ncbi:hemolysin D [Candidatus Magnetobacterium bavaricum]|uniref:Hemolysin D n=1 Tax=Candidatus Magnetobacterium bavaricum TaxID=29290 RepID=A0A0F3GN28_9BACT|nr:hemolysin D [Candidatus Magnetobacterium bavaricum]
MVKKIAVFVLILICVAGGTYFVINRNKGDVPRFRTEKLTRGDITSTVTSSGTLNAVTMVNVGTQVSGIIQALYVDFNSPVKKGQLIARIDPALFVSQVDQARANLYVSQANLKKAEATLLDTKRTLGRNDELLKRDLIAQAARDTAATNYDTAAAQVDAAKAQIAQSQAALAVSETNLRYTKIVSPVDGTVVSRTVDVGQTVAASFQTPTLFSIAQDLTKMQIDTNVAEADIGRVEVGQDVDFSVDAYPDVTFKGSVVQVRNAPIVVQNVVTYDVVVRVENPDFKLKPGMTANVSIVISRKQDVLKLPNAALRFKPPDRGKTSGEKKILDQKHGKKKDSGVWINEGNTPKRIAIDTGINDGAYTELISGDLVEGQELIVESLDKSKTKPASGGPRMF